jgi:hypothetical protein
MSIVRHMAVLALLLALGPAGAALANEAAPFHEGLNDGARAGLPGTNLQPPLPFESGQTYYDRFERTPGDPVPYSRIFPERNNLNGNRDLSRDPQGGCRSVMMNAPDAIGRMAHWRATECLDAQGRPYVLPGSQMNLGYY